MDRQSGCEDYWWFLSNRVWVKQEIEEENVGN